MEYSLFIDKNVITFLYNTPKIELIKKEFFLERKFILSFVV